MWSKLSKRKKLLLIPYSDIQIHSAVFECEYTMDSLMNTISFGFAIKSSKLDNLSVTIGGEWDILICIQFNMVTLQ